MSSLPELLAPAGNAPALHAAVSAGADAVYVGLGSFNARRNADNFTFDTFEEACDYAHLRDAKIYVTLNTIILPHELNEALETARQAYRLGADAFIVQDIGLASRLKAALPDTRLHISTQMNIHSTDGLALVASLGADRVTFARELSLGEIEHLSAQAELLGLETEVFAHGAICICYSGQCFMSSMIGGRSANRGLCAQACRLPYELICKDNPGAQLEHPGDFLLSPKDLCTIDKIDKLAAAGVSSLKIEGRMKSAEYVFSAVRAYRHALDAVGEGAAIPIEELVSDLESVFSRGFTSDYLVGKSGNSLMGYTRPNNRGQFAGRVKAVKDGMVTVACEIELSPGDVVEIWTRKANVIVPIESCTSKARGEIQFSVAKDARKISQHDRVFRVRSAESAWTDNPFAPRIPVTGTVVLERDKPLKISFALAHDPAMYVEAEGVLCEAARTKAITEDEVSEHVNRLGNTPFELVDLEVDLGGGIGIGFSKLHHVRSEALRALEQKMLASYKGRVLVKTPKSTPVVAQPDRSSAICALVANPDCARAAKRAGARALYVPVLNYRRGTSTCAGRLQKDLSQAGYPRHCIPVIPAIEHDAVGDAKETRTPSEVWEYVAAAQPVMVSSLGALEHAIEMDALVEVGPSIPVTNKASLALMHAWGVNRIWLSPELNEDQIEELASDTPMSLGIVISGAQELMVSEHCMLASQGPCAEECATCVRRTRQHVLKDRKGYEFPVVVDGMGRSHLYNSVALDAVSLIPDLLVKGVTSFMVDATLLDVEQTAQSVGRAVRALDLALRGQGALKKLPDTTLGHLHRGVS